MTTVHPFRFLVCCVLTMLALFATPASAHPAPFSYLDIRLQPGEIEGTLNVHAIDLAHELQIEESHTLHDERVLAYQYTSIKDLLSRRIVLTDGAGRRIPVEFNSITPVANEDALQLTFRMAEAPPAALSIDADLFPYDPTHQTFVNVYDQGELAQQFLFDRDSAPRVHYAGSVAGIMAVLGTFVPAGFEHVLIGPDHVAFVLGLILLGGTLRRLALIVTMFTLGHSVTLGLAATSVLAPPAWLVEPLIALSIVVVGVDNLIRKPGQRDLRAWFAVLFGLVHGFGFAFVLREFGLPQGSLAAALFGFNVGVELGQLAIVVPATLALAWLRSRSPLVANRLAMAGSLAVALAGAYWFVDRVQNLGSG
ncbi:MAG: HupE/UreJ family protein [Erythrobacter sp.]|nr:HupE/UreJ family protein [Erythrobacter sp.]